MTRAPEFGATDRGDAAIPSPDTRVEPREVAGREAAALPGGALPPEGEPCVLLKLGEIALKGQNRPMFERQLYTNLRQALRDVGRVRLWARDGVVLLKPEDGVDLDAVVQRAQDVLGIVWVHPGVRVPKSPEATVRAAIRLLADKPHGSFAVRARRRDKRFPMRRRWTG